MTKNSEEMLKRNDRAFRSLTNKIGISMILFLGIFYFLNFLVELIVGIISMLEIHEVFLYTFYQILLMIAYLSGFIVPALILRAMLRGKGTYQPMFVKGRLSVLTPLLIIATIALNFAASSMNHYLVNLILPIPNIDMSAFGEGVTEPYQIILMFVSTAVVPAICEEILFRGVVLTNLIPYGRTTAILGSAFLFGLMHGNILQFLYTSLMGVILGYVYIRTKSLICCSLIHFFNNGIAVFQTVLLNCLNQDSAMRWNGILEFTILIAGAIAVAILLTHYFYKKRRPEDYGSFGVILEPALDYEQASVTKAKKLKLFFAPSIVVFLILSGLFMILTLFALVILGAMG